MSTGISAYVSAQRMTWVSDIDANDRFIHRIYYARPINFSQLFLCLSSIWQATTCVCYSPIKWMPWISTTLASSATAAPTIFPTPSVLKALHVYNESMKSDVSKTCARTPQNVPRRINQMTTHNIKISHNDTFFQQDKLTCKRDKWL